MMQWERNRHGRIRAAGPLAPLAFLVLAVLACRRDAVVPRGVILISVDTLRADRLACYGYGRPTSPAIDRLASQGTVFERAEAPRGMTWPSLTTILTGEYPVTHGVRTNGDQLLGEHRLISEILRDRGYATGGFITNMVRAPNRGFEELHRFMDSESVQKSQAAWDRDATAAALAWLGGHHEGRFFLWVHYIGPHRPYAPEGEFRLFVDPSSPGLTVPEGFEPPKRSGRKIHMQEDRLDQYLRYVSGKGVELTEEQVAYVDALYDGEVLCVDREVGRVLEGIDALGIAGETLVIFVADHGEELYRHNRYFYHACSVYETVLHVPLVIRMPGRVPAGERIRPVVELTDIAPTILDLLGEAQEAGVGGGGGDIEGVSLAPLLAGEAAGPGFAIGEWYEPSSLRGRRPILTVREGDWKLIWNPDGVHPDLPPFKFFPGASFPVGRRELYRLDTDPGEARDLAAERPEVVERLRGRIDRFLEEHRGREGKAAPMDAETIRRLMKMGYLTPAQGDEAMRRIEGRRAGGK